MERKEIEQNNSEQVIYSTDIKKHVRNLTEYSILYFKVINNEIPGSEELKNSLALSIKDQCKAICDFIDLF